MKDIFKRIPLMVTALCATYSGSSYAMNFDQVDYYFALDGQYNSISYRPIWKDMFKKNPLGANIAFGIRPDSYYGLELGFQWTDNKGKDVSVASGSTFSGLTNSSGSTVYYWLKANVNFYKCRLKWLRTYS